MVWVLLAIGLYLDILPVLALGRWTSSAHNPPSSVPVLAWLFYAAFCFMLGAAWWEKILVFIALFFGPALYRYPIIEARRRWLIKNGK